VVDVAFQGPSCGVGCTDITNAACSCTQAYYYWSATNYALNPQGAWAAFFATGDLTAANRSNNFAVRAVRSGS
jgi:hypothetical protein